MIVIERTVDLSGPIHTEMLRGNEFTNEALAHTFIITVMKNGEQMVLDPTEGAVTAYWLNSLEDTLLQPIANCSIDEDGRAVVTLHSECYSVPGRFHFTVYYVVAGSTAAETEKTCIYSAKGTVVQSVSEPVYDPGDVISDITEVAAKATAAAAVAEEAASHQYQIEVDDNTLMVSGPAAHNYEVEVEGTTVSITAESGIRYVCTATAVSSLAVTLPTRGIVSVVFKSGTTPTSLQVTGSTTVKWPTGFNPASLLASVTYELNIADGLGAVGVWS